MHGHIFKMSGRVVCARQCGHDSPMALSQAPSWRTIAARAVLPAQKVSRKLEDHVGCRVGVWHVICDLCSCKRMRLRPGGGAMLTHPLLSHVIPGALDG